MRLALRIVANWAREGIENRSQCELLRVCVWRVREHRESMPSRRLRGVEESGTGARGCKYGVWDSGEVGASDLIKNMCVPWSLDRQSLGLTGGRGWRSARRPLQPQRPARASRSQSRHVLFPGEAPQPGGPHLSSMSQLRDVATKRLDILRGAGRRRDPPASGGAPTFLPPPLVPLPILGRSFSSTRARGGHCEEALGLR
jgi:hypothetical protein